MCEEDFGSYSSELGVLEASEQGKDVPGWASAGPLWLPAEGVCEGGGRSREAREEAAVIVQRRHHAAWMHAVAAGA